MPRPLLGFLLMLLCLPLRPALQSLLPVSEITVPQRLLGRAEENTDAMIYAIIIDGRKQVIYLVRQALLPSDFAVYLRRKEGAVVHHHQPLWPECYYQGYMLDQPRSAATLRACAGLRGLLELANDSYVIEPLLFLHGFKHLVSKLESERRDLRFLENDTELESLEWAKQKMATRADPVQPVRISQKPRYLKLAVFITKELFDSYSASVPAISENMLKMISLLNTRFSPLNIRVFLISLEIWAESNPIDMSNGTVKEKLDRFITYAKSIALKRRPYDIPLLLSVNAGRADGMVYFGSVCTQRHGVLAMLSDTIEKVSSVVAHMLGHSLGLFHDNYRSCECSGTACLMHTNMGVVMGVQSFSSCSIDDFNQFISTFGASCLLNLPNLRERGIPELCGNKRVDEGEACDCGSASECQADPCCDVSCQLKGKAACARGLCCRDCMILPKGTQCRVLSNECDLPEYCDGVSPTCAEDTFQQNGNLCRNQESFCYGGKCADLNAQCQQFFGPESEAADPLCFLEANSLSDRFGNCGFAEGKYEACTVQGSMCGKIQCNYKTNLPIASPQGAIIYYAPQSTMCVSIDLMKRDTIADPAWVADGTKCGDGRLCIARKCEALGILNNKCSSGTSCSGHGVCNSKGSCHCNDGWSPPTCASKGHGGSIDSGSRMILLNEKSAPVGNSLTIWLLIGFGIFIPLVFITIVMTVKRDSIQICCEETEKTDESEEETDTEVSLTATVTS